MVPPEGANVWIEFEGGDPDYPILAGCFWADGEGPSHTGVADHKVWKSESVTFTIDDQQGGGMTIEVGSPAVSQPLKLVFDPQGINHLLPSGLGNLALFMPPVEGQDFGNPH